MSFANAKRDLFVEFKENSIHILDREEGLEIPLEREATGRIPLSGISNATAKLRAFLGARGSFGGRIAYCSIPSRGVSLRRMNVPAAGKDEVHRLLTMQLEAQLPMAPADLAWGCRPIESAAANGKTTLQEFLVVAVRKELLDDYRRILGDAGLTVEFTIGALARRALCLQPPDQFSVLEVGRARSELASFDARGPIALRVLPWGSEVPAGPLNGALHNNVGQKLYVAGAPVDGLTGNLAAPVEVLDGAPEPGRTSANLGLKRLAASDADLLLLGVHEPIVLKPAGVKWKWAALAALLMVLALSLRYAEALVYRSALARKLSTLANYRSSLPKIEREFDFLNFIKTNQPPYIDTLTVVALSAPPGTHIETLSLVRRGELTLRGNTSDAQAPGAFRSRLIDSGFFSRVVVDEQLPSPDGQKVTFRLSAQLKPDGLRKPLSLPAKPAAAHAIETADPKVTRK